MSATLNQTHKKRSLTNLFHRAKSRSLSSAPTTSTSSSSATTKLIAPSPTIPSSAPTSPQWKIGNLPGLGPEPSSSSDLSILQDNVPSSPPRHSTTVCQTDNNHPAASPQLRRSLALLDSQLASLATLASSSSSSSLTPSPASTTATFNDALTSPPTPHTPTVSSSSRPEMQEGGDENEEDETSVELPRSIPNNNNHPVLSRTQERASLAMFAHGFGDDDPFDKNMLWEALGLSPADEDLLDDDSDAISLSSLRRSSFLRFSTLGLPTSTTTTATLSSSLPTKPLPTTFNNTTNNTKRLSKSHSLSSLSTSTQSHDSPNSKKTFAFSTPSHSHRRRASSTSTVDQDDDLDLLPDHSAAGGGGGGETAHNTSTSSGGGNSLDNVFNLSEFPAFGELPSFSSSFASESDSDPKDASTTNNNNNDNDDGSILPKGLLGAGSREVAVDVGATTTTTTGNGTHHGERLLQFPIPPSTTVDTSSLVVPASRPSPSPSPSPRYSSIATGLTTLALPLPLSLPSLGPVMSEFSRPPPTSSTGLGGGALLLSPMSEEDGFQFGLGGFEETKTDEDAHGESHDKLAEMLLRNFGLTGSVSSLDEEEDDVGGGRSEKKDGLECKTRTTTTSSSSIVTGTSKPHSDSNRAREEREETPLLAYDLDSVSSHQSHSNEIEGGEVGAALTTSAFFPIEVQQRARTPSLSRSRSSSVLGLGRSRSPSIAGSVSGGASSGGGGRTSRSPSLVGPPPSPTVRLSTGNSSPKNKEFADAPPVPSPTVGSFVKPPTPTTPISTSTASSSSASTKPAPPVLSISTTTSFPAAPPALKRQQSLPAIFRRASAVPDPTVFNLALATGGGPGSSLSPMPSPSTLSPSMAKVQKHGSMFDFPKDNDALAQPPRAMAMELGSPLTLGPLVPPSPTVAKHPPLSPITIPTTPHAHQPALPSPLSRSNNNQPTTSNNSRPGTPSSQRAPTTPVRDRSPMALYEASLGQLSMLDENEFPIWYQMPVLVAHEASPRREREREKDQKERDKERGRDRASKASSPSPSPSKTGGGKEESRSGSRSETPPPPVGRRRSLSLPGLRKRKSEVTLAALAVPVPDVSTLPPLSPPLVPLPGAGGNVPKTPETPKRKSTSPAAGTSTGAASKATTTKPPSSPAASESKDKSPSNVSKTPPREVKKRKSRLSIFIPRFGATGAASGAPVPIVPANISAPRPIPSPPLPSLATLPSPSPSSSTTSSSPKLPGLGLTPGPSSLSPNSVQAPPRPTTTPSISAAPSTASIPTIPLPPSPLSNSSPTISIHDDSDVGTPLFDSVPSSGVSAATSIFPDTTAETSPVLVQPEASSEKKEVALVPRLDVGEEQTEVLRASSPTPSLLRPDSALGNERPISIGQFISRPVRSSSIFPQTKPLDNRPVSSALSISPTESGSRPSSPLPSPLSNDIIVFPTIAGAPETSLLGSSVATSTVTSNGLVAGSETPVLGSPKLESPPPTPSIEAPAIFVKEEAKSSPDSPPAVKDEVRPSSVMVGHSSLLPHTDDAVSRKGGSNSEPTPPLDPSIAHSTLMLETPASPPRPLVPTPTQAAVAMPRSPPLVPPPRPPPPTVTVSPSPPLRPSPLPSVAKTSEHRIFIVNHTSHILVTVTPTTKCGEIVSGAKTQGALIAGKDEDGGWALFEICRSLGLERPIREAELLEDVVKSWHGEANILIIRRTPLWPVLALYHRPKNHVQADWVQLEAKKGKWNKRHLVLKDGSLLQSKSDKGKDASPLCRLIDFEAFLVAPHMLEQLKPPKPFMFALKSTLPKSKLKDEEDYCHYIGVKSQEEVNQWVKVITEAKNVLARQRDLDAKAASQKRIIPTIPTPPSPGSLSVPKLSGSPRSAPTRPPPSLMLPPSKQPVVKGGLQFGKNGNVIGGERKR